MLFLWGTCSAESVKTADSWLLIHDYISLMANITHIHITGTNPVKDYYMSFQQLQSCRLASCIYMAVGLAWPDCIFEWWSAFFLLTITQRKKKSGLTTRDYLAVYLMISFVTKAYASHHQFRMSVLKHCPHRSVTTNTHWDPKCFMQLKLQLQLLTTVH